MTFNQFVEKHLGKGADYDGVAGVQCVDLIKCYLNEVFGIKPGAWGNAHCWYNNFGNIAVLKAKFTRIANTADFVPKQGDIVVWSSSLSKGGWGHIAIASGEGDTKHFYSYDQNWTGKHDACEKIRHSYSCVLGVLRPIDQTPFSGEQLMTFKVNVGGLHYRLSPSLSGKVCGTLKNGSLIQVVKGWGRTKDGYVWYKFKQDSKYYYCAAKYLKYVKG